jgi:hypothetical protein
VYKMPSYRISAFDMRLILLPKYGSPPLMVRCQRIPSSPIFFSQLCREWRRRSRHATREEWLCLACADKKIPTQFSADMSTSQHCLSETHCNRSWLCVLCNLTSELLFVF